MNTAGNRNGGIVARALCVALCTALYATAAPIAHAQATAAAESVRQYDIPAGPLSAALSAWGAQSDRQLVFAPDVISGKQSKGVSGRYSAEQALTQLLAGTGLTWERANGQTIAIKRASAPAAEPQAKARSAPATTQSVAPEVHELEKLTVTGSRLLPLEAEGPSPVVVFYRQDIDKLGVSNVADLLGYLPQRPFSNDQGMALQAQDGSRGARLRGMRAGSTLVLINGRRAVTSATSVATGEIDLNTIPMALVDRVEILSESASAIYGADAVGGVINIILKNNVPRPVLDLRYGTADGGAEEKQASLSLGYTTDRLRILGLIDHTERGYLMGSERERFADQDYRRFGSIDVRTPYANPGNVCSTTGSNLPGLPTRCAAVPQGSTGVGLSPSDFIPTAGLENRESLGRYQSIIPKTEMLSGAIFGEFDISQNLTVFGQVMYVDNKQAKRTLPLLFDGIVPAQNIFNPFGEAVSVRYLLSELDTSENFQHSESYNLLAGLKGGFSGGWDWELSVLRTSEDAARFTGATSLDPVAQSAALSATDPSRALNLFGDGAAGSSDFLRTLVPAPRRSGWESDSIQGSGFVRGSLFDLPAGVAEVVLGGEWREEKILLDHFNSFVSAERNVSSAFSELRVPLIGSGMQVPSIRSMTLTLAARHDHYSDFGNAFNPQVGLTWEVTPALLLRGSYGTSYRAPNLFELYSPRSTNQIIATDVLRNNERPSVTLVSGGNPGLDPEKGKSANVGFVFMPEHMAGLRLSANAWWIELDRRVLTFSQALLIANGDMFPERVIRAERTPEDIVAGLPGVLLSLDTSYINFGRLRTSGIDLGYSQSYRTEFGDINPSLAVTWVNEFKTVEIPGTPAVDRVGLARANPGSAGGTIPRWRAVATLGWTRGGWGLSTVARYVPSYEDVNSLGVSTGRAIPAQTLVDLQGTLNLDQAFAASWTWLRGVRLAIGISNAFDEEPNFVDLGNGTGFDPGQSDLRQRFGYLTLSKTF